MKKEISKAKYFWNINNCDIVRPTQSLNIRSQTLVSLRDYLINEIYEFYVCLVYQQEKILQEKTSTQLFDILTKQFEFVKKQNLKLTLQNLSKIYIQQFSDENFITADVDIKELLSTPYEEVQQKKLIFQDGEKIFYSTKPLKPDSKCYFYNKYQLKVNHVQFQKIFQDYENLDYQFPNTYHALDIVISIGYCDFQDFEDILRQKILDKEFKNFNPYDFKLKFSYQHSYILNINEYLVSNE